MRVSFRSLTVLGLGLVAACERREAQPASPREPPPSAPRPISSFPAALHVPDESVNAFVRRAMKVALQGDYEQLRLLWSTLGDPVSREEYEEGWKAVERIDLMALREVRVDPSSEVESSTPRQGYVLVCALTFDPNRRWAKDRPDRDVVLLIVREGPDWRLARAPRSVRDWIGRQLQPDQRTDDHSDGPPPPPPEPAQGR